MRRSAREWIRLLQGGGYSVHTRSTRWLKANGSEVFVFMVRSTIYRIWKSNFEKLTPTPSFTATTKCAPEKTLEFGTNCASKSAIRPGRCRGVEDLLDSVE